MDDGTSKASPSVRDSRPSKRGPTQADTLVDLSRDAQLFHDPDGKAYADVIVGTHRECWPILSKGYRQWLVRGYYHRTQAVPNSEALKSALNLIEAQARFDAPERSVYVRVGELEECIYLDLGDSSWRAVKISVDGWEIVADPPLRFRRSTGMQPLPSPERGGAISALRSFLNVKSNADFVLVVSWLLSALRGQAPYPVLVVSGEQGSAKSTFSTIIRSLVDPNSAPLRALPREERDLFIAASHAHVLAFDNVSGLSPWVSDSLCRVATGGGFAARQLYTDQDEVLFDAARPIILNGIEDIVTRPDLADRGIFLHLEPIPEKHRRSERDLLTGIQTTRPQLLGVLLDGLVQGLSSITTTSLPGLPRMADFALWGVACEAAFWSKGTFWQAYRGNLDEAVDDVIDSDVVAAALRTLMSSQRMWRGTASQLHARLGEIVTEPTVRSKSWPANPRALAGRLRRAATFLRKVGIETTFEREGQARDRIVCIEVKPSLQADSEIHSSSVPSATETIARMDSEIAVTHSSYPQSDVSADDPDANKQPPSEGVEERPKAWSARL